MKMGRLPYMLGHIWPSLYNDENAQYRQYVQRLNKLLPAVNSDGHGGHDLKLSVRIVKMAKLLNVAGFHHSA